MTTSNCITVNRQPATDIAETRETTHERDRFAPPAVDIHETPTKLVVVADMPGLEVTDIEVTTEKDVLTIKGSRREVTEREYIYREFAPTGYFRQFALGKKIDQTAIEAAYKNGVLTLTLPFAKEAQPRSIQVRVS
jgi:HSP20 family molecular chaperone IbpA